MNNISFLPEGFAENALLLFFRVPSKLINVSSGCHGVARAMKSQVNDYNKVLVGIVDKDKNNVPSYFNDFVEIKTVGNLILKKKPQTQQYLIIINPEFEKWIIDTALSVGISPEDFSLPSKARELHDITSNENLYKNKNFNAFLKAIKEMNPSQFESFQTILNTFYERKYY